MSKIKKAKRRIRYKYNSPEWKRWRTHIFYRDYFTCQFCGTKGKINAHHIKRKVDRPDLAYTTKNGITLCVTCHAIVTDREQVFEQLFTKIVNMKLTSLYVIKFLEYLIVSSPIVVLELKHNDRWENVMKFLINKTDEIKQSKKRK